MKHTRRRHVPFLSSLVVSALLGLAVGCEDEEPMTGPDTTTTTTAPAGSSVGLVRAAQLTVDARTVDIAIDGEVVAPGLAFPGVSSYVELSPGEHRIQFFPAGASQIALLETTVELGANEALTIAIVGNDPLELVTMRDDRSTTPDRARLRMFNAVADFPANLDMSVVNGPPLFSGVAFRTSSSYRSLVPGIYALRLLRGGTREELARLLGADLLSGTTSTAFAVGSLARDDIRLFVARDAP